MRVVICKFATMTFLSAVMLSLSANAQNLQMNATVNQTGCTINVLNNGTLGLSGNSTQLSSKLTGGTAGTVRVTSTANYFMSAIAPTLWNNSPIAGNGNTTFQARFSGTSVTNGRNFAERDGANDINTQGGKNARVTDLTIHLIADSTAGAFPNGSYNGQVAVLCE